MLAINSAIDPMASLPMSMSMDPNPHLGMIPSIETDRQGSHFRTSSLNSSRMPSLSRTPQLPSRRHTSFGEAYSDGVPAYENGAIGDLSPLEPATGLTESDNLLQFSTPRYNHALLDYTHERVFVGLTAQLHGIFLKPEPVISETGETLSPLRELMCYRRNLFSISGHISVPRNLRYILTDQNERLSIAAQELELSATESVDGNPVKLMSVPLKTPPAPDPISPEEKAEKDPSPVNLDLLNGSEVDPQTATVPIFWNRLQFRGATANNGRRRQLQQHFTVNLRMIAVLDSGQRKCIFESTSLPLVVRGRSPRNFQDKRELPVSSISTPSRKHGRSPTADAANPLPPPARPMRPDRPMQADFKSNEFSGLGITTNFYDWGGPMSSHLSPLAMTPQSYHVPRTMPATYAQSSPNLPPHPASKSAPGAVSLSLTEGDLRPSSNKRKASEGSDYQSHKVARRTTEDVLRRSPPFDPYTINGPTNDSIDHLYEYFPLGMDEWEEPVEALYRPHAVHHINNHDSRPKLDVRSRRYFSSEAGSLTI
ncbi:MAG: hypothetical protein M1828_005779 [Chrysothrix sp. TS-e1954]|nr:MAG: hypothetical protein M1828_005779 [Chrysothrix sp. TS-e1954]